MKRILLPVTMIAIMIFFVSCGNTGQNKETVGFQGENAGYQKGDNEFLEAFSYISQTMRELKAAKTCEELDNIIDLYDEWDYPEDITDMEKEKLYVLCDQIEVLYEMRAEELCDDWDDWVE